MLDCRVSSLPCSDVSFQDGRQTLLQELDYRVQESVIKENNRNRFDDGKIDGTVSSH